MKKIFTISFLLSGLVAVSQPTINSNWFPGAGTTLNQAMFDATNVSEGPAGANQNWNYNPPQTGLTQTNFVTPASTPYASNFPTANIAASVPTVGTPFYSYYNHTSSGTELVGFAYDDASAGLTLLMNYSDPQKQFQYPLTYNQQFTDNFTASYTVVIAGLTIINYRYGTIYSHADAYGTITTPSGTFNNTLRVKTRQVTTDSAVYVGFPAPPTVQYSYITSFLWIGDNPGQMGLFQISYDTITDDQGTPPSYGKDGGYLLTSVGINEVNLKAESINAYPNPAKDFTYIDAANLEPGDATLEVFDALGKLVKSQIILVGSGSNKSIILHTLEFNPGFYILNITQNNKLLQSKFIKQ